MMRKNAALSVCWIIMLTVGIVGTPPEAQSQPLPTAVGAIQPNGIAQEGTFAANGPQVSVTTPAINWGDTTNGSVPYDWSTRVSNPNSRPVVVKVKLDFVDSQGQTVHEDWVSGQIGPSSDAVLQQTGTIDNAHLDLVAEALGAPTAWWADEPYRFRTVAAFVDGLQRLEVFFVLEDWEGRPVTASGVLDLYIVERERPRAAFAGGGMQRPLNTLYARRFDVGGRDYSNRRIGFKNTDYTPPAVTLGPIHYSIFDQEPIGDEGVVRLVFRTASGNEIVGEDRVYF
ncbi:MAG TPA: hypothetical protein QGG47_07615 [Acidobacteriota bacterium]|nr:hypothetical protein [Acidobacteriota bacterium]